jgi:hypothetical protein
LKLNSFTRSAQEQDDLHIETKKFTRSSKEPECTLFGFEC